VYCFDVTTLVCIGMIVVWQIQALMFLLDKRLYEKHKRFRYFALSVLLFWCLFAIVSGGLVERMYAVVTICGTTAVELVIRRRRRLKQHDEDLQ
jgi:heme A synthase